ncbi:MULTISPECIES: hypothetical protein [Paenibacillus]|uniref:hypothetical protein n=1 Tax=Paenibacillus TaxID=44249 RepID=UPI0011A33B4C|nr:MULTISPECIES: hypothetical protein [Paenibacillus]MBJ9989268.1 hypothetical protein [Paenibacillus sp. S28]
MYLRLGKFILGIILLLSLSACSSKNPSDEYTSKLEYKNETYYTLFHKNGLFKKSGTSETTITDEKVSNFFIYNDHIFYLLDDPSSIQVVGLNGEDPQRVFQGEGHISFDDYSANQLLFLYSNTMPNSTTVYKLDLNTFEPTTVYSTSGFYLRAKQYNNKLFISSDKDETFEVEDGYAKKLFNGVVSFVLNDQIYVSFLGIFDKEDQHEYGVFNLDGSGKKYISEEQYDSKRKEYLNKLADDGIITDVLTQW